jgi:uncharacterized membrane protein YoaK (UPF0700 family)
VKSSRRFDMESLIFVAFMSGFCAGAIIVDLLRGVRR